MAILVFTKISTFLGLGLGQAPNGKRSDAAAPKLDRWQARAGAVWQRTPARLGRCCISIEAALRVPSKMPFSPYALTPNHYEIMIFQLR